MICLTPLTLFRKNGFRTDSQFSSDVVPCGKCPGCISTRRASWVFRLQQEKKISTSSAFLTLTYSDENIPVTSEGQMTLQKSDHQKFIKRLRKHSGVKGIKYYSCGEYGDKTLRPHFHSILFNVPQDMLNPIVIDRIWQNGIVDVGTVTDSSIAYVAQYVNKKLVNPKDIDDSREPEFSLMSKGMGANYMTPQMVNYHKNHLNPYLLDSGGIKRSMPRYYKDKMFTDKEKSVIHRKAEEYLNQDYTEKEMLDWKHSVFRQKRIKDVIERQSI